MARSIMDTIKLGGVLVLALPVAALGIELLLGGTTFWGGVLVVVAVLMVVMQQYLPTPADIPQKVTERTIGSIVPDEDENDR